MSTSTTITEIESTTESVSDIPSESTNDKIPSCYDVWFGNATGVEGDVNTCIENQLYTGICCLDQNFIIGLAAGAGGLVIIILLSVIIWLAEDRKKYQLGKKKPNSEEEANGAQKSGLDNPAISLNDIRGDEQTANRTESTKLDQKASMRSRDGFRPPIAEDQTTNLRQSKSVSNDVYQNDTRLEYRPASHLYDDIEPFQKLAEPGHGKEDKEPPEYYNAGPEWQEEVVGADGLKRKSKQNKEQKQKELEKRVEDNRDKEKVLTVAGIDIAEFEDFEPNLDHVDPKTDYKIKRPQFEG